MEYVITKAAQRPSLKGLWNESAWRPANVIALANFLARSKSRHPRTEAKVVYQDDGLFVFFRVFDNHISCVLTEYQSSVCQDCCVEFFATPDTDRGYLNFEINCGGTMLLYHCQSKKAPGEKLIFEPVPWELGRQVTIYHSLPKVVNPEIEVETEWRLEYFIPFKVFDKYFGPLGPIAGQVWRANFYKCGGAKSYDHWVSWAPIAPILDFHVPQYFAPIKFQA